MIHARRNLLLGRLDASQRDPHGGLVTVTLFALLTLMSLLPTKAFDRPAERFDLDPLVAPDDPALLMLGARRVEFDDMLTDRLAEPIEE